MPTRERATEYARIEAQAQRRAERRRIRLAAQAADRAPTRTRRRRRRSQPTIPPFWEDSMKIGVEIECVRNNNILDFSVGAYHRGTPIRGLPGWKAERDASLNSSSANFHRGSAIEIISSAVSITQFRVMLADFKKYISKNGEHELHQVLDFNNSCGNHVHFSIDGTNFTNHATYDLYQKVRKYFFKLLRESNLSTDAKRRIRKSYFRHYSRRRSRESYRTDRERYSEFNLLSESSGRGMEWRSINFRGVKTWDEFMELYEIIFKVMKKIYDVTAGGEKVKKKFNLKKALTKYLEAIENGETARP
jgi:hypothetical protein